MLVERKDSKNNRIVQEYVLPDFSSNKRGRIRDPDEMPVDNEQVLYMENERFSVPEVLFQPAYIGKLAKTVYSAPLDLMPVSRSSSGRAGVNYRTVHCAAPRRNTRHVLGQHRSDWGKHRHAGLPG